MDELEISGKRYISTRRAAKEYKYHSDYIGQLIRGKKLLGRKVGRSWYVELESLTQFFKNEPAIAPAPTIAKAVVEKVAPPVEVVAKEEAPVIEEAVEEVAPIKEKVQQRIAIKIEKPVEARETVRDSFHIPIRVARPSFENPSERKVSTLTYVSDDEPGLPLSRSSRRSELSSTMVMPQSEEEVEEILEDQEKFETPSMYIEPATKSSGMLMPVVSVLALGVVVLLVVVGGSILVASHTVIEAGKAANVEYSL